MTFFKVLTCNSSLYYLLAVHSPSIIIPKSITIRMISYIPQAVQQDHYTLNVTYNFNHSIAKSTVLDIFSPPSSSIMHTPCLLKLHWMHTTSRSLVLEIFDSYTIQPSTSWFLEKQNSIIHSPRMPLSRDLSSLLSSPVTLIALAMEFCAEHKFCSIIWRWWVAIVTHMISQGWPLRVHYQHKK